MRKLWTVIGFLFCFNLAYAGLSVIPSITNVFGVASAVYEGKYTVKNTYDRNINITVEVLKGNSFSGNGDIDINKLIALPKNKFFIPAGESIEVPYKVTIYDKFKGSLCGKLIFSIDMEKGETISMSISVPIYVTVEGTENVDFKFDSIDLYKSGDSIVYKMVLNNEGNVHIRHSGNIEIYTEKRKNLVKNIEIEETVPTYCEQKREFINKIFPATDLEKGKYFAVFKARALGKEITKQISFKVSRLGEIVTQ